MESSARNDGLIVCKLASQRGKLHLRKPDQKQTLCGKKSGISTLNQTFTWDECRECYFHKEVNK